MAAAQTALRPGCALCALRNARISLRFARRTESRKFGGTMAFIFSISLLVISPQS